MSDNTADKCAAPSKFEYEYVESLENFSVNERLGCSPIANGPQKKVADNGLLTMSNQNTLVAATVLIPASGYDRYKFPQLERGDIVYVPASLGVMPWAKQQYDVEGEKVIFIPMAEVLMVRKKVRRCLSTAPTGEGKP